MHVLQIEYFRYILKSNILHIATIIILVTKIIISIHIILVLGHMHNEEDAE